MKQKPAESVPFDRDSSFDYYHKMSRFFFCCCSVSFLSQLFRESCAGKSPIGSTYLPREGLTFCECVCDFVAVSHKTSLQLRRYPLTFLAVLPSFALEEEVGRREGKLDGERFGRSKSQIEIIALNKQSRCQVFSHELYGLSGGDGLSQTGSGPRVRLVL